MSLTDFLVNIWYSNSSKKYLFLPLTLLYRSLLAIRKILYDLGLFKKHYFPVPVVVVGNITVGGTGKTPLVIALVGKLQQEGFKPGVVSRGYGSLAPAYPFFVDASSSVDHAGDEPYLIAVRTNVPVVIDPHRYRAVNYLIQQCNCDVIITDDGLQHYALARDVEIAVIDGQRQLGNGHCLPMGPLREPRSRLRSVDYTVFNGEGVTSNPTERQSIMVLKAGDFQALDNSSCLSAGEWELSTRVHAVAGIGNPQRFYLTLRQLGFTVIEHDFSDHHKFSEKDFQFYDDLPIIMTEKDAVKARTLNELKNCWYLPVEGHLELEFTQSLVDRLRLLVNSKQRSYP